MVQKNKKYFSTFHFTKTVRQKLNKFKVLTAPIFKTIAQRHYIIILCLQNIFHSFATLLNFVIIPYHSVQKIIKH